MARAPKQGVFFNCKLSQELVDQLNAYAEQTRLPKTVIVEMALEDFFRKVFPDADKTDENE